MGKMQAALKKAEQIRSRSGGRADGAAVANAKGPATATAFAIAQSLSSIEVDPHLVALTEPQSSIAEQYRQIAANLAQVTTTGSPKVILVTSAVPAEGKSVTTVNLAGVLAESGEQRVVVVDADLRKPAIHRLLGIDNQRGLADYLGGSTMLEMVLQRSRLPNLWVLPAGRTPADSGDLLAGERMDDLLTRLRRDYDHVLLDTPPVVSTGDTACLAPRADGTVLVLRMERTPREVARHAVELLKKARARLVGTVLTGVDDGN
jgi:capsular exopolysaccharide synthesis family protein